MNIQNKKEILNNEGKQNFLNHIIKIWIYPEIEKRKKIGKLNYEFSLKDLKQAQIIFSLNGKNIVKLNNECIMNAEIEFYGKRKKIGDPVYSQDIKKVNKSINQGNDNKGYINMLLLNNKWIIDYDFRYNSNEYKKHLKAAKEFYEIANYSLSNNLLHPFWDNAFSCSELLVKCIFMGHEKENNKNHETRIKKFKKWAELGNIDSKFSENHKRLMGLRSSARYLSSTEFKKENPHEFLKTLEDFIQYNEKQINQ